MVQKVNPVDPDSDEAVDIRRAFDEGVNMTAAALRTWLQTDDAKEVGQKRGGGESVGHDSGRRIVAILGKNKGELTGEDYAHMKKVNGHLARHLKQKPDSDDLGGTTWAKSLKNWGHDPTN